jgi:hypothetical protein
MGASLARWRSLSGRQKSQLVLLAIALPATGALIRLVGFQKAAKVCARIGGQAPLRQTSAQDLEDAQTFASLAGIAGRRGPVTTTCLRQSLVVRAWLRRRGLDARLKIGVRKTGDAMDAHAWVELDGVALAQPKRDHAPFPAPDLGA